MSLLKDLIASFTDSPEIKLRKVNDQLAQASKLTAPLELRMKVASLETRKKKLEQKQLKKRALAA